MTGDDPLGTVVVLGDRLRRAIYYFIRRQNRPVTRDEAASAVGISRKLAAFHLDKLVDAALLEAAPLPADQRPKGPGRTPKAYVPAPVDVAVSLPPRDYRLAAELLLEALADRDDDEPGRALDRIASERGEQWGREVREQLRLRPPGPERTLHVAEQALESAGFEPHRDDRAVWLANCPFHALAQQNPELVCHMNQAYLAGFLRGLASVGVTAELHPRPGACCVQLRSTNN
jgi:predicted ArsR family transcriptional regulator